jgi:hypothetical protein
MKRQGSEIRDQGSEIRDQGSERTRQEIAHTEHLLRQSVSPFGNELEPGRDLWPAMQRRLAARPVVPPWFDWALAGGLAVAVVAFPAWIPVFLYYL